MPRQSCNDRRTVAVDFSLRRRSAAGSSPSDGGTPSLIGDTSPAAAIQALLREADWFVAGCDGSIPRLPPIHRAAPQRFKAGTLKTARSQKTFRHCIKLLDKGVSR